MHPLRLHFFASLGNNYWSNINNHAKLFVAHNKIGIKFLSWKKFDYLIKFFQNNIMRVSFQ